jgi:tripartite-type tricarboxylate transporter receptor subunit TctC
VAALVAGEIDTATVPVPDVIEHHKAGTVTILGVTDTQRHFLAPDVPTFQEQGHDVVIGSLRIIVGPNGIPEDRLQVLEDALMETLSDPQFIEKANAAGFGVSPMNSEETTVFLKDFDDTLYPVLKGADLVKTRDRQ